MTMGAPETITPPCAVISPIRAAGLPPIKTVAEPFTMTSVGPVQMHISPTLAAGMPEIMTVGQQAGIMGPPTWGTTPVTIGQVCISEIREAGGIRLLSGCLWDRKTRSYAQNYREVYRGQ